MTRTATVFKTKASDCMCAYADCRATASDLYLIQIPRYRLAIPFCSDEHLAQFALSQLPWDVALMT